MISALISNCVPKTPTEFENKTIVEPVIYTKDSLHFVSTIEAFIQKQESAFYPPTYSETRKVYIDTILYNQDLTKCAFLVILELPNSILIEPEDRFGVHFDANAFRAIKDTVNQEWKIKWFRIMNLGRFSSYSAISETIRFRYFRDLATLNDHDGSSRYKYNMNDIRFWDGPAFENMHQLLEENESSN
jgi:hypothetical protein